MADAQTNGAQPDKNAVSAEELETLRQQLASQTERAAASEKKVAESSQHVVTATDQQIAAQKLAAENAIAAATAEADRCEQEYAKALEEQRFGDAAKAQRLLGSAQVRLENFMAQKAQIENFEKQWASQKDAYLAQQKQAQESAQADPLAAFSAKSKAWISRHPKFLSDGRYQARVTAAHYKALSEGHNVDSDDYFDYIETEIGEKQPADVSRETNGKDATDDDGFEIFTPEAEPDVEPVQELAPERRTQRPATTAAPVSRSLPRQAGGRPSQRVELSQREMEAAKYAFPDEYREDPKKAYTMYAQNKIALQSTGKLN